MTSSYYKDTVLNMANEENFVTSRSDGTLLSESTSLVRTLLSMHAYRYMFVVPERLVRRLVKSLRTL